MSSNVSMGTRIRALRIKSGFTQEELANIMGCKQTIIWRWENDYVKRISPNNLKKLATVLDTTQEYIERGSTQTHEDLPQIIEEWLTRINNRQKVIDYVMEEIKKEIKVDSTNQLK